MRMWNVVHLQSKLLSPAAEAFRYSSSSARGAPDGARRAVAAARIGGCLTRECAAGGAAGAAPTPCPDGSATGRRQIAHQLPHVGASGSSVCNRWRGRARAGGCRHRVRTAPAPAAHRDRRMPFQCAFEFAQRRPALAGIVQCDRIDVGEPRAVRRQLRACASPSATRGALLARERQPQGMARGRRAGSRASASRSVFSASFSAPRPRCRSARFSAAWKKVGSNASAPR